MVVVDALWHYSNTSLGGSGSLSHALTASGEPHEFAGQKLYRKPTIQPSARLLCSSARPTAPFRSFDRTAIRKSPVGRRAAMYSMSPSCRCSGTWFSTSREYRCVRYSCETASRSTAISQSPPSRRLLHHAAIDGLIEQPIRPPFCAGLGPPYVARLEAQVRRIDQGQFTEGGPLGLGQRLVGREFLHREPCGVLGRVRGAGCRHHRLRCCTGVNTARSGDQPCFSRSWSV